jgi:hypothetical protein
MKVFKSPSTWYFSKEGLFTGHMQAVYFKETNTLEVSEWGSLHKVIKYLGKELGITELTLKWYSNMPKIMSEKFVSSRVISGPVSAAAESPSAAR